MRRSDIALRAVRLLHADGGTLQAAEIASGLGSTPQFVPQVLAPMVKAGWLTSEPGPRGGYRLRIEPSTRSILDLIELIEGPTEDGACVLRDGSCTSAATCSLHDAWTAARDALIRRLASVPLVGDDSRKHKRQDTKGKP